MTESVCVDYSTIVLFWRDGLTLIRVFDLTLETKKRKKYSVLVTRITSHGAKIRDENFQRNIPTVRDQRPISRHISFLGYIYEHQINIYLKKSERIMFLYSHLFKALIILTGVNAFSSIPSRRSKASTMPKLVELHMATTTTTNNLSGKVIGKRHIYRLSPQSPIQTPYSIEERQYYAVGRNGSLKPVTDKFVIVRGEVTQQGDNVTTGKVNPSEQTVIGPALYGMAGLQDGSDLLELESSSVDSSYAMTLFCMQHPQLIQGKGLELGW